MSRTGLLTGAALLGWPVLALAADTPPVMPDAGVSVLRVLGALALVLALFFGGVWLVRHRQRFFRGLGQTPLLQVLEARSLGNRHTIYVVGYAQQRLLLASAPTGVTLLSHLPTVTGDAGREEVVAGAASFPEALHKVLGRT